MIDIDAMSFLYFSRAELACAEEARWRDGDCSSSSSSDESSDDEGGFFYDQYDNNGPRLHHLSGNEPTLRTNRSAAMMLTNLHDNPVIATNTNIQVSVESNVQDSIDNQPPAPWATSRAKQRIIDELKDENSDIHLYTGKYSLTDWKCVNFKMILEKYASSQYKMSNFRENVKRILKHYYNKTGEFKKEEDVVEPWYTSVNNASPAYKLLWFLYMDPKQNKKINVMTAEQIWHSHPKFQQYDYEKFKKWDKAMQKLTSKKRKLIDEEEDSFQKDMIAFPRNARTSRDLPFWHTHAASKLLKEDVRSGHSKSMKPMQLWRSKREYQEFPLLVFRKHIYQERTKQLAAPCWQHTRNQIARKKTVEEAQKMKAEWHESQWTGDMDKLVKQWSGFTAKDKIN